MLSKKARTWRTTANCSASCRPMRRHAPAHSTGSIPEGALRSGQVVTVEVYPRFIGRRLVDDTGTLLVGNLLRLDEGLPERRDGHRVAQIGVPVLRRQAFDS